MRLFQTYELDEMCRFKLGPNTETINFNELKALMLSKDDQSFDRLKEMTQNGGKCLFLDGKQNLQDIG